MLRQTTIDCHLTPEGIAFETNFRPTGENARVTEVPMDRLSVLRFALGPSATKPTR